MDNAWDLHIHSGLSPCSSDDMTPNNIVNMALIKGLKGISVTDHNSVKNLGAIDLLSKNKGLEFIPGVELTTKEEIHLLIYFPSMDKVKTMDDFLLEVLPSKKNRASLFGHQWIYNEKDEVLGEEPRLLTNATKASLEEAIRFTKEIGGVAVPAHVDRKSYSILSNLGFIPPNLELKVLEISKNTDVEKFLKKLPSSHEYSILVNSDAHYLQDILEAEEANFLGKDIKQVLETLRKGIFRR